jgi:hypothetical protein
MDFTLFDAIGTVFSEDDGSWDKVVKVYDNFANDFLYPNINNIMVLPKIMIRIINEVYKMILKIPDDHGTYSNCPRIPQLYYGSEIGMSGDKDKGDADIRQDFPGGWLGDENNAFTKEAVLWAKINILILLLNCSNGEKPTKRYILVK